MTWVKLDDHFGDHPKVVALSDAAFRLHVNAFCYCGRHLTNGKISRGAIKHLPYGDRAPQLLEELVTPQEAGRAPLWQALPSGDFQIHDWLEYNRPASRVKAERAVGAIREQFRRKLKSFRLTIKDVLTASQHAQLPPNLQRWCVASDQGFRVALPSATDLEETEPAAPGLDLDESAVSQLEMEPSSQRTAPAANTSQRTAPAANTSQRTAPAADPPRDETAKSVDDLWYEPSDLETVQAVAEVRQEAEPSTTVSAGYPFEKAVSPEVPETRPSTEKTDRGSPSACGKTSGAVSQSFLGPVPGPVPEPEPREEAAAPERACARGSARPPAEAAAARNVDLDYAQTIGAAFGRPPTAIEEAVIGKWQNSGIPPDLASSIVREEHERRRIGGHDPIRSVTWFDARVRERGEVLKIAIAQRPDPPTETEFDIQAHLRQLQEQVPELFGDIRRELRRLAMQSLNPQELAADLDLLDRRLVTQAWEMASDAKKQEIHKTVESSKTALEARVAPEALDQAVRRAMREIARSALGLPRLDPWLAWADSDLLAISQGGSSAR